jgi:pyruvate dehydrogenase E2 component (dihydrolipoamide acetyltransferase)
VAIEVVLPRLGWDMTEGSLVEWLKKDGDAVRVGDVICTVEGDKAINEVESLDEGILRIPPDSPSPGVKVPVGTVLGYLVQAGERAPFEPVSDAGTQGRRDAATSAATGAVAEPSTAAVAGTDHGASFTVRFPDTQHPTPDTPSISPRARRIAAELGVDWTNLQGSGRTGRIVERDIRAMAAAPSPPAPSPTWGGGEAVPAAADSRSSPSMPAAPARPIEPAAAPTSPPPRGGEGAGGEGDRRTPLTGIRRTIAERLATSARTVVPVTLTTEADATDLVGLREQIKRDPAGSNLPVPTYNDFLAKLVALALQEHPALNASLVGEEIVWHAAVNVGLAVDTDRGLLVPVVRDVARKPLQQIAEEAARLVEQARTGQIATDDLRGSTFTITNLGMYEIDAFTPVINLPDCAVLGVGRIVAKPVVIDAESEKIAVRKMLAVSLTFDHRLVDGAPAARFLQRIKHLAEHPTLGLIR